MTTMSPHTENSSPAPLVMQAAAPDDSDAPRLNEALSSKARHPSAIPGSFYERDRKFKAQSVAGKGPKVAVVPRTEGPMQ